MYRTVKYRNIQYRTTPHVTSYFNHRISPPSMLSTSLTVLVLGCHAGVLRFFLAFYIYRAIFYSSALLPSVIA